MERIWGGQKLEELFGKQLPAGKRIGESWEIVDRPEAQSVVANGSFTGHTLHELWSQHRQEIFGNVPSAPRFPLLIKLLDAQEKLSLQVHPPEKIAAELGGEPKTECWYIAGSEPNAELFAGFKKTISRAEFESNLLEKLADPVFTEDMSPLLVLGEHPSPALHPQNAGRTVMDKLIALIPGEAWKRGN